VLVLQGGALGAHQAGVDQALTEAQDLHLDWAGEISIGAINSAIIAGYPPEERVARNTSKEGRSAGDKHELGQHFTPW
jgi:NTE family protein